MTNNEAFPVEYDYGGLSNTGWRVWRPDKSPHLERHRYETEARAQARADRINAGLSRAPCCGTPYLHLPGGFSECWCGKTRQFVLKRKEIAL